MLNSMIRHARVHHVGEGAFFEITQEFPLTTSTYHFDWFFICENEKIGRVCSRSTRFESSNEGVAMKD